MKKLFTPKPIEELYIENEGFKKSLGKMQLLILGFAATFGAGIFVLTGHAAAQYAGPSIILSFLVAAVACIFTGLCYAEFSAMMPVSGSAYTYTYASFGKLMAWIIALFLLLEYGISASAVAVGWSGHLVNMLQDIGIILPSKWTDAPIVFNETSKSWEATGNYLNFPAIFLILFCTFLLTFGIKQFAKISTIIVGFNLLSIGIFIFFGLPNINIDNLTPFFPENLNNSHFAWTGLFLAAPLIFFSFLGFDAIPAAAQEAKNPQKDIPITVIGSITITTILYILIALVMVGVVHYSQLDTPQAFALTVDHLGEDMLWFKPFIKITAFACLSIVTLVVLYVQVRIFYAMAKDGLLPKKFTEIHHKFGIPRSATILTGVIAAIFAGIFPIDIIGELVSMGSLFIFTFISAGVIVLRYRQPNINRPFKTGFFPLIPILGILSSLGLIFMLPTDTWWRMLIYLAVGFVIFACIKPKK